VFARLNDLTRQLSIENVHDQEDEQLYSKFVQVIFKSRIIRQQEKADVVPETEQKHHFQDVLIVLAQEAVNHHG
jgi:hypothetical protein